MTPPALSLAERTRLHDEAVGRAHELRRQAIVDGWNALFRALRRLGPAHPAAHPRQA